MQTFVTVLTRADGRAAGKTFDVHGKHVANHTGQYHARTVTLTGSKPAQLLAALDALVGSLSVSQLISASYAPDLPDEYEIRPKGRLPGDGTGVYWLDGKLTIARLKQHYRPSRLLLLDYDPDERQPPSWSDLDEAGRWDLLCAALPEFAGAARLTYGSASGRVLCADGKPLTSGGGSHTFIVLDREITAEELDSARAAFETRQWAAGLGYHRESKDGARLRRALIDSSTWCSGREIFDGPPAVSAPLNLADRVSEIHDGDTVSLMTTVTQDEREKLQKATGARIQSDGARLSIDDVNSLTLATEIETERGVMTVGEFLESGADKLRCQATFRESYSWAGILRRTKQGAVLYDTGTSTNYKLCEDPETLTGALDKDLKILAKATPATAHATARAIIFRHAWRCPVKLNYRQLLLAIENSNPHVRRDDLRTLLKWMESKARAAALAAVTINPASLPTGVEVHVCQSMSEIRAGIEAIGTGVHIAKGPHASGKTRQLIEPIACAGGDVIGIAPRVSLVSDLATRCNLAHYQSRGAEFDNNLALCINSINNPKYATALSGARVVLVDEIARVVRDCHDRHSTHKDKARAVWTRLINLVRSADLAIGVDADLNNGDVQLIAKAVGRLHVWILSEAQRDLSGRFVGKSTAVAEIEAAVADNIPTWVSVDSSRMAHGLALALKTRYPERRILAIHDMDGRSTLGTPEVLRLLSDINGHAAAWDVVIASPAVESGVSLEVEHFQKHVAIYGGTLEPSAMNQALLRDRTATAWTLGISGHGKQSLPDTEAAALNALAAAQRIVSTREDGLHVFEAASEYDRACCAVMAAAVGSTNRYAADLWYLLEARGWSVSAGAFGKNSVGVDLLKAARDCADSDQKDSILFATDLDVHERERLESAYCVSQDESAQLARFDVLEATGCASEDLDADLIELWNDGRLHGQNRNFDALTADARVTERDKREREAGTPLALRSLDAARAEALQLLFDLLGIDRETGAGTVTAESVLTVWHKMKNTDEGRALEHFGICRFERPPMQPVKWLGTTLKRLGLWLEKEKHGGAGGCCGRSYVLAKGYQKNKAGRITLPGWDKIMAMQTLRRMKSDSSGYKNLTTAAVIEKAWKAAA